MRKRYFISILAVIIIVLAGCKKNSSVVDPQQPDHGGPPLVTPIGTPVGTPVSKTIGSAGGSLIAPDGRLELNIPAGALKSNTNITIQPVTNEAPGGLGLAYDLLPDGIKFDKPVTLTFHYTDAEVPDNKAYFLFIAYQDSSRAWTADSKQRDFDTIAKTVNLEINHFSIWTYGTTWRVLASPQELKAIQTSSLKVMETVILDRTGQLTSTKLIDNKKVGGWKINGKKSWNGSEGKVEGTGASAVYHSPLHIDIRTLVYVSAEIITHKTFYKKGQKIIEFDRYDVGEYIALQPDEYNYNISLAVKDSTVSQFYTLIESPPIYLDHARFHLNLRLSNKIVTATISNIENHPPSVNPPKQAFAGHEYIWLADPIGVMNITGIVESAIIVMHSDSIVVIPLKHSNAHYPGFLRKRLSDGRIVANSPPQPFPLPNSGLPTHTLEIDLKRRLPYIKTYGASGTGVLMGVEPL